MPYLLPLEPRPAQSPVPLTAVQRRYWNEIARLAAHCSPFRMPAALLRISGALNVSRLQGNLAKAVMRHESLRTRIACVDLQPLQIVDVGGNSELQKVDLSHLAPGDREETARRLANEFLSEEVDLRVGPVCAARLLKMSADEQVLFLGVDHIVSDAMSALVLTREVLAFSEATSQSPRGIGHEASLQFADYAVWEHRTNETWLREHEPYWRARFSGLRQLTLPGDDGLARNGNGTMVPRTVYVPFGDKLTAELREVARRERCLMPMLILSLYLYVMSRWCERNDLLVKFLSHGRHGRPEFRNMIGCLAHSIFLRVEIVPGERLRDFIGRVSGEFQSALAHDAARVTATTLVSEDSTELCFNWLPPGWGPSGTRPIEESGAGLKIEPFAVRQEIHTRFMPFFMDTPTGLLLGVMYDGEQFLSRSVERFAAQLKHLAEDVVNSSEARLDPTRCRM
jgi:hypothetical protein